MNKMKVTFIVPSVCRLPIVLVLIGIGVMIVGGFFAGANTTASYSNTSVTENVQTEQAFSDGATQSVVTDWRTITEYHQNRLQNFLKDIQGVGRVSVMVYCDRSSILELVSNHTIHTQHTEETDGNGGNRIVEDNQDDSQYLVLEDKDGNQRIIAVQESIPAITSVCVVCEGGGKMVVQERVTAAISTLYDLSPSKIVVLPGK